MAEELFEEIVERIGDREKEFVMRWWLEEKEALLGIGSDGGAKGQKEGEILEGTIGLPSRL